MLMPLLAAAAFIFVFAFAWMHASYNIKLAEQIETEYFPAVKLSHRLEKLAVNIRHTLQNAITVEDIDLISDADEMRDLFVGMIERDRTNKALKRSEYDQILMLFNDYYDLAKPVSIQMIESGLSDELFEQAALMNQQYDELINQLQASSTRLETSTQEAFSIARKARNAMEHVITLATLISLGLIVLVSIGIIYSVVRPLRRITTATEEIAHGKLDASLEYSSRDELGRLASSFRKMQRNLIADIERRENAEQALRESEERYRGLFENATSGIIRTTAEGKLINFNPAMMRMIGYDSYEDVRRNVSDIGGQVYANREERSKVIKELRNTGQCQCETRFLKKTGDEFDVQMSLWCVRDKDNENINIIEGIITDISARKQAEAALKQALADIESTNAKLEHANQELQQSNIELRSAQAQLIQSEKMASLGRFVAGIAHEFNNPIAAVQSSSANLSSGLRKLETVIHCEDTERRILDFQRIAHFMHQSQHVIDEGSHRVTGIVDKMKNFVRLDESELQKIDIHQSIEDTLSVFEVEKKERVTIHKEFGELPLVVCYPARLNQLFLQILSNANHAIMDIGEITIRTALHGNRVRIEISDTGMGIAKDRLSRIFEPGFTTWGVGVGVGLGLTIAYQVVQDHKGSIDVTSDPEHGTTFTIELPIDSRK